MGPALAAALNAVLILVQGWSSFSPGFNAVDFVSFYVEIGIMLVLFVFWKVVKRTRFVRLDDMDFTTDRYEVHTSVQSEGQDQGQGQGQAEYHGWKGRLQRQLDEKGGATVLGRLKRVGMWLFL